MYVHIRGIYGIRNGMKYTHVCVFLAGRMKVLLGSSSYFLEYIHAFLSSHNIKLFNNRYLFCLGFQVVLIKEKLLLLFCIPPLYRYISLISPNRFLPSMVSLQRFHLLAFDVARTTYPPRICHFFFIAHFFFVMHHVSNQFNIVAKNN